jgi:hypothetical protein
LARVYEKLKLEQIVRIRSEPFSVDSRPVKVNPDGTEALKKGTKSNRQIPRWMAAKIHLVAADA